jgi:hypothetical protein
MCPWTAGFIPRVASAAPFGGTQAIDVVVGFRNSFHMLDRESAAQKHAAKFQIWLRAMNRMHNPLDCG